MVKSLKQQCLSLYQLITKHFQGDWKLTVDVAQVYADAAKTHAPHPSNLPLKGLQPLSLYYSNSFKGKLYKLASFLLCFLFVCFTHYILIFHRQYEINVCQPGYICSPQTHATQSKRKVKNNSNVCSSMDLQLPQFYQF